VEFWQPLEHAGTGQHDGRRAKLEATEFVSALQLDGRTLLPVVAAARLAIRRRADLAGKYRFNTRHDHRTNQYHYQRSLVRIEETHRSFVACKQRVDVLRRHLVDREQLAGHVAHFLKSTAKRHVHAVVVTRREVDGGKVAVVEARSEGIVATQQCG